MPKETILVIDDSRNFAQTLTEYMLTPLGYNVLYASNGRRGLKMAVSSSISLILLDMSMPVMSGLDMLTELRRTNCQAPVIFMTMHGSEHVAVKAFRLGVRDYLSKPFTIEELQRALDDALQETRLVQEKEKLARNLLVSETIRQTVVTLSHHINNHLTVLSGSLELLQAAMSESILNDQSLPELIEQSRHSTTKIEAVLAVLRKVTDVKMTTYHGQVKMIDIEAALNEEMQNKG